MVPAELLHLLTRAGAVAMGESGLGIFEKGFQADFVVHDPDLHEGLSTRLGRSVSSDEVLGALLLLGSDRTVSKTFIQGKAVFKRV